MAAWAKFLGEEEVDWIHIGEMLSYVAFACKRGPDWVGALVFYTGDNKVVKSWIATRRAKTRAGRLLIRLLNAAEMRYRFRTLAT